MASVNESLHKAIRLRLADNWNEAVDGKIAWPNADFEPDDLAEPWIRFALLPATADQFVISGLPAPSGQRFRGIVAFQIFAPVKTGTLEADRRADKLAGLFNQVRVPVDGGSEVCFFVPSQVRHAGDQGADSGVRRWHQANMSVPYEFLAA